MELNKGFTVLKNPTVEGLVEGIQDFQETINEMNKDGDMHRFISLGSPFSHDGNMYQVYYVANVKQIEEETH